VSIELSGPALAQVDRTSAIYQDLQAIAPRLAAKDHTLWGQAAEAEASIRLNWIDLPHSSTQLLPALTELATWSRAHSLTNIILAGMGGSSLAPEVISKTFQKELTVLDSTDPAQIHSAIPASFINTIIVVGSKSGSTIETASQRALFTQLILAEGLNPADHLVIVTDPGSPLDLDARAAGLRVINADPHVGGRYSALSAFGLVPAALMGVDVAALLASAQNAAATFASEGSVAVDLAYLLFTQTEQNLAFFDSRSQVPGLSDWIEQLIAESTGKDQKGRLPIVIENPTAPIAGPALRIGFAGTDGDLIVAGSLGEQFILWEWATALLSRALALDPFNQPNVTEAKERTGELLAQWRDGKVQSPAPTLATENVEIFTTLDATSLREVLAQFLALPGHYLATMAYLHRGVDDAIAQIRPLIATKSGKGTTFGWGPRFLHSTGQFHKGGQHNGLFIQITGESAMDIAIPEKNFGFHTLLMAQALGDGQALASRNFPTLRLHLKNRSAGIAEILTALESL
jgi:glucose-6-phosphate isomerase